VRWRLKDVSIDRTTTDLTLVEKLVPLGALSPNEARDRFNLPASDGEGMNDYYVATTLRPIEQAIQPPEPTAPPLAHPALAGLVNGGQPKRIRGGQNGRVPAQSPAR
jgi:hypothetical protein